ncbi:RHTO0S17e01156g1_1 [Rhodotorula toruloides]|uniref:RHTO0S17e01156g1_1 n=1 Tax=Rhodotorula toruloides TaxID=5286 RepID=A0A061BEB2_RHOTO|nr:RHTO0S17e01156g1_1 [Rhodotorula toruloides]
MQCGASDEPHAPARQPLGPLMNDAAPSPALKRLSVPPASLPSPSYVRLNGRLLSTQGPGYCKLLGVFVVAVTWEARKMVVKYGPRVAREEGEVMRLVAQQTRIPVPKLLGMSDDAGETFIYQEYVEGNTLDDAWDTLSSADINHIKSDFTFILSELASLPAPPGVRLGACDNKASRRLGGPFQAVLTQKPEPALYDVDDLKKWIRFEIGRRSKACARYSAPPNVEDCLVQGGVGLVHADLHGGNIIVKDGRITAIIDGASQDGFPERSSRSCWSDTSGRKHSLVLHRLCTRSSSRST